MRAVSWNAQALHRKSIYAWCASCLSAGCVQGCVLVVHVRIGLACGTPDSCFRGDSTATSSRRRASLYDSRISFRQNVTCLGVPAASETFCSKVIGAGSFEMAIEGSLLSLSVAPPLRLMTLSMGSSQVKSKPSSRSFTIFVLSGCKSKLNTAKAVRLPMPCLLSVSFLVPAPGS